MNYSRVAIVAMSLLLGSQSIQAESLRDIYELALENDAQLKEIGRAAVGKEGQY